MPRMSSVLPVDDGDARPLLPYGNGRSYGDTCLNDGGIVIDCRSLDRILDFDGDAGVIRAEAGVLLSEIIDVSLPQGWFLPVTPGTRFVTLGGAIANDVHGKNHHRAGTLGAYVERFELLRSDGTRRICSPTENADWFRATVGGVGLTGIILWAELRLRKVESGYVDQSTVKVRSLAEYFDVAAESDERFEYTVAWIDSLAAGASLGRGLLMRAEHAPAEAGPLRPSRMPPLTVPFLPPVSLINRASIGVFNALQYGKQRKREAAARVSALKYFYPLDGVTRWNRLYGPKGLVQHQSVIPFAAKEAVGDLLKAAQKAKAASFVTVLKTFGDAPRIGLMSFPRAGVTLTLDFAHRGEKTLQLLAELDRITVAAGGAVNPYKDARMSAATFEASFPWWRELLPFKDPRFSSSFWRRVTAG
ncbi:MAG: FAD-binding oxidoreductase [Bauldia sp.]